MLKKLITAVALAAATLAGDASLSVTAEAHGWHHKGWHHKHPHWHHAHGHHSHWFHKVWRYHRYGGGWEIHGQPWWVWQHHHRWHHHHDHQGYYAGSAGTHCWWKEGWRHGHAVSVKVCKTVYY